MSERITWTEAKRSLGELLPWPHNPRQIRSAQAERLLESVEEFGLVETLAVDPDNEILNGHQRLKVLLQRYGPDYTVDVRVSSRKLSERERQKLTVYLHKGATGEWDFDALANTFDTDDLLAWGFEAAELGLDDTPAPVQDAEPQIDRAEELRQKWGVSSGDLWQLGEHRLLCGDCTDADVVARGMDGERAVLCFTSPPYADIREYSGNDLSVESLAEFVPVAAPFVEYFCVNLGIKREGGAVVPYWDVYIRQAAAAGLKLLSWNVWDQGQVGSVGKLTAMFPIEHEFIFVFGSNPAELNCIIPNKDAGGVDTHVRDRQSDGRTQKKGAIKIRSHRELGTVARCSPQLARDITAAHPAPFPIELAMLYVESFGENGAIVLDPFSGSGTTLIACESLGRKCRAVEISPAYCAVALQRFCDATGKTPARIASAALEVA